jgi:hypothetical protein
LEVEVPVFLWGAIVCYSQSGDRPQEDLAKVVIIHKKKI